MKMMWRLWDDVYYECAGPAVSSNYGFFLFLAGHAQLYAQGFVWKAEC